MIDRDLLASINIAKRNKKNQKENKVNKLKKNHTSTPKEVKAKQSQGFFGNLTKTFNKPAGYGNCRTLPKKNWQQNLGGFGRYVKTT